MDEADSAGAEKDYSWREIDIGKINSVRLESYKGSDVNVVIPSVIEGKPVIDLNSMLFRGNIDIEGVTIPGSVISIGAKAFYDNGFLESVTFSEGVTSIGDSAFSYCNHLKDVTIPDSVTSIARKCFYYNVTYKGKTYSSTAELYNAVNFGDKDFIIEDNVLQIVKANATKIELPNDVTDIVDSAFIYADESIIIVFKGKNYNLTNLNKLKADMSGENG